MDDIILRRKYIKLRSNLYNIKNKLIDLQDDYNYLTSITKQSLLIDNEMVDENLFKNLNSNNKNVIKELTNVVIPRVNNKI